MLAVLKAARRAVHGADVVASQVPGYYMALELATVYTGMMIALPPTEWAAFGTMSGAELDQLLRAWAEKINLNKVKKAPARMPTKNKLERIEYTRKHVSTARLLADEKETCQSQSGNQNKGAPHREWPAHGANAVRALTTPVQPIV
ncbi:hypothetical protein [Gemmata obscuriglobus]|uniref:hypothetical protein n=1 Tax=Gemmata obscuriglobus TaxID=114 RepID=UPI00137BEB3F|nr:hypothetical protein [Gemmata obscuriglobus]VTS11424.1 Transposase family protein OS=Leptolyngbya sp. PCC 7375 GN=Lepto7375DRAFT_2436 PE=4 SV=1 [Gemmata obscuriglobus UQM 2246]